MKKLSITTKLSLVLSGFVLLGSSTAQANTPFTPGETHTYGNPNFAGHGHRQTNTEKWEGKGGAGAGFQGRSGDRSYLHDTSFDEHGNLQGLTVGQLSQKAAEMISQPGGSSTYAATINRLNAQASKLAASGNGGPGTGGARTRMPIRVRPVKGAQFQRPGTFFTPHHNVAR